jgi:hypothetical protein
MTVTPHTDTMRSYPTLAIRIGNQMRATRKTVAEAGLGPELRSTGTDGQHGLDQPDGPPEPTKKEAKKRTLN